MTDYIKRTDAVKLAEKYGLADGSVLGWHTGLADCIASEISGLPAADVAPVVRCKDCKYSTLPSELTQRYGKAGTLTCHNKYSPCNRRNVSENDFCSYGEERGNG
jgi:hypothetical protein|nr:MAG TPA: hypothetical protein [Caudoviricetes sp.]